VKKICEHHAGVEIRQTGISRQSGSSTYTVQFSILTEYNLLLESYFFGDLRLTMEFPGDINVFDAVDFETAVPRSTGRTTVELLVQARPTGRIADHYRLAMGGSALLEAKPVLSSIFPDPKLDGFLMVYLFWCKDVVIRRNMTTSKWMDCLTLITSNTVGITDLDGNAIDDEELKRLLSKELLQHRAAIRHAVVIGPDQRMALEIQAMPASEAVLTSKPAFVG
jgi:hypothetical protein